VRAKSTAKTATDSPFQRDEQTVVPQGGFGREWGRTAAPSCARAVPAKKGHEQSEKKQFEKLE
jgi:hypothetical protein